VATETLCTQLMKSGHELIVLTQMPEDDLHEEFRRTGVRYYTKTFKRSSVLNYFLHFFFLIKFCRKHKIDVVWSNLNQCSLPAVFAQYFIKARVVVFRHHFHAIIKLDGFRSVNKNERIVDRIVGKLAKEIVVPSLEVYNGMVTYEKIKAGKITIIPYMYDFDKYKKPDPDEVRSIRNEFSSKLLILTASRMIKMKRHDLVLPVFKKLLNEGYDIKVLLLDDGEEKENLRKYVEQHHLGNSIFFLGYRPNITDYLAAADLLVHPSYTEASSSLVKEFGLMRKPVIVCSGVGDFDQYIVNRENGFIVNPPEEAKEFEEHIRFVYQHPDEAAEAGKRLHDRVMELFSPNQKTMALYQSKIS
jgi:glycosyltransferase involved in cell wall biosynthesis